MSADSPTASVVVRPAARSVRAVALVLPGGKANSLDPTSAGQLTAVRMRPFAAALHCRGAAHGLEVRSLLDALGLAAQSPRRGSGTKPEVRRTYSA